MPVRRRRARGHPGAAAGRPKVAHLCAPALYAVKSTRHERVALLRRLRVPARLPCSRPPSP
eukprot:1184837-Prymnesium_polylepis.1